MVREVHTAVQGRARFRVKGLYRCDALKSALETELPLNNDVLHASANVLTGNVLVVFNPSVNRRSIVLLVEHIAVEHFRAIPPTREEPWEPVRSKVTSVALRQEKLAQEQHRVPDQGPAWHCIAKTTVLETLGSSPTSGLTLDAVARNRATYGANAFAEDEPRSRLSMFIDQFKSLPVALLGVAAALSAATAGVADAVVIVAVVGINAVIGYLTESEAEAAIASLKNLVKPRAIIVREGETTEVGAEEVVVGDIVLMKPGTYVPADARIIEASHLSVDESILTGESLPVTKTDQILGDPGASLGDRLNMLYAGTLVVGGHGAAVVVAAGSLTEVGKIRSLLVESEAPETPIERQLTTIGNQLVVLSGAVCGLVFFIGLLRGNGVLQMLKTAISLAVAAVPGLPTVATTTLALGVKNMRQHKVLIRNLEAICTLGSVQTLCFDKTGTVTLNKMSVLRIYSGMDVIDVLPDGLSSKDREREFREDDEVHKLVQACVLCNETELIRENGTYSLNGSATESALIDLAFHVGMDVEDMRLRFPRLRTEHRSDDRQFMATVHDSGDNRRMVCLKGSPLEVLAKCTHLMRDGEVIDLTEDDRDQVEAENDTMAGDALRVLGVGFVWENGDEEEVKETGYVWLGLVGMADPLRAGAKESIQLFHHAGLETVMITGDQSPTAFAIGRELGLNNGNPLEILDSAHLTSSDPGVLEALCKRAHVFSRISPSKKLQIVQALQSAGKVVAMTGDGINDGPALKAADIGIAMGKGGTDVAREVADVILEEDDLETLSIAIRDGRTIYLNIRKTLHYLLATNLSEIEVMFLAGTLGLGYPLNAMQLLWINLISDIFPGLALAMEPPEVDVMERPPRDPNEAIVQDKDFKRIAFEATTMAVSSLAAYGYGIARYGVGAQAGTLAFQSLTGSQIVHALSCRSEHRRIIDDGNRAPNPYLTFAVVGSLALQVIAQVVPGLRGLLGITPITAVDGLVVAATGLLPLLATEATKERDRAPIMKEHFIHTSESVTEGHPDKVCDQISDAIIDRFLEHDFCARVTAECAVSLSVVFISARFASKAKVDFTHVARKVIRRIGYVDPDFDFKTCSILTSLKEMAPKDQTLDAETLCKDDLPEIPVDDQVTLFGFACDQTPSLMPLPIYLAHKLSRRLAHVRLHSILPYLSPDGTTQVAVEFKDHRPYRIYSIAVNTSQTDRTFPKPDQLRNDIMEAVVDFAFRDEPIAPDAQTRIFVNPGGPLRLGGPSVHSGLTGRKNAIDTYGGFSRNSGSALSGKDPMRIDRVGAYMARYAAKNVVAAGLAEQCEVLLSYTIGLAKPASIQVETMGTGKIPDEEIAQRVRQHFDFSLTGILSQFNLRRLPSLTKGGFFRKLAAYGHFGRTDFDVPWERTDKVDLLKEG